MVGAYNVITLCGSTCFREEFEEANKHLTLEGNIVISVGLYGHAGDEEVWEGMSENALTRTKIMLDDMHKRKIDMADEIFVINVGGYVGASTRSEIAYARAHGKGVRYLEPPTFVFESLDRATMDDVDEVWRLYVEAIEQSARDAYSPRWTLGVYPTKEDVTAHIEAGNLYVARANGAIRAAMVFVPHEDPEYVGVQWSKSFEPNEVAVIHLLVVHPCIRGRGGGAELVDGALRLAYESGLRAIHLDVVPENMAASRIYTAAGFRYAGSHHVYYEDLGDVDLELYEYVVG